VPDGWYQQYGLNPTNMNIATGNADGDPFTNREEWVAMTDPTDAALTLFYRTKAEVP
jgi:hypothetical protein